MLPSPEFADTILRLMGYHNVDSNDEMILSKVSRMIYLVCFELYLGQLEFDRIIAVLEFASDTFGLKDAETIKLWSQFIQPKKSVWCQRDCEQFIRNHAEKLSRKGASAPLKDKGRQLPDEDMTAKNAVPVTIIGATGVKNKTNGKNNGNSDDEEWMYGNDDIDNRTAPPPGHHSNKNVPEYSGTNTAASSNQEHNQHTGSPERSGKEYMSAAPDIISRTMASNTSDNLEVGRHNPVIYKPPSDEKLLDGGLHSSEIGGAGVNRDYLSMENEILGKKDIRKSSLYDEDSESSRDYLKKSDHISGYKSVGIETRKNRPLPSLYREPDTTVNSEVRLRTQYLKSYGSERDDISPVVSGSEKKYNPISAYENVTARDPRQGSRMEMASRLKQNTLSFNDDRVKTSVNVNHRQVTSNYELREIKGQRLEAMSQKSKVKPEWHDFQFQDPSRQEYQTRDRRAEPRITDELTPNDRRQSEPRIPSKHLEGGRSRSFEEYFDVTKHTPAIYENTTEK